jgi:hypothetical protein
VIDFEARAKLLEAENDELRGRVSQLEAAIGIAANPPLVFGLTKNESIMFGVLMNNGRPARRPS